jgi:hypothetical protein
MVMKRILTMLVFAAFSELAVAQSGASTPSVDSILDRFVQALGGHAALEKITTMAFTGVMNIPGAQGPGKATEYFEHPDHFGHHGDTRLRHGAHGLRRQDRMERRSEKGRNRFLRSAACGPKAPRRHSLESQAARVLSRPDTHRPRERWRTGRLGA